ncbi:winged helix-turn-helix domain-containing protein [Corallococcus macrosporus]|uniref:Winged helix-turn-helix domain-containing protein n=1 Tax=Corallococcus macrosporus TaxID=35 RepID=A0ABS3DPJ5_9BACT|nr:AAA family ATPase [Corallococcus macrosporus]MBN8233260.1 winged helix-turn-helix domain-containing protein [Corallococcus macrosporus]
MRTPSAPGLGPPAVFVGRAQEVRRLGDVLKRVHTGVVYGLPGAGKSALVAAVAAKHRGPVVHRRVRPGDTLDTVVDDVRRLLSDAPVAQALSDASRLEALAGELEARRALCVLDDLHVLGPPERAALVEDLGGRLRQGTLLATSRESVPRHAASPDRVELRLEGLTEEAARELWRELDALYGERDGFDAAWERSRGLPFLLRRAHAGDTGGDEPVRAALAALPGDERRLAAMLALSQLPLTAGTLEQVLAGTREQVSTGEALRQLGAKLLVETDSRGRYGVHDLVREAMVSLLSPDEARAAHEALLEVLQREPLPAVVRVRGVCRHLQALGQHEARAAFIVAQAEPLVRHGAADELLGLLDSLPAGLRTPQVRLAHARARVRLLDLRRAYPELLALRASLEASASGPEPESNEALREGVGAVLVRVALFALEPEACERTLEAMPVPSSAEVFLQQLLAWTALRFFQGRLDESLAMLDNAAAATGDRRVLGWCAYARALMLWIEGRDSELAEPLAQCVSLLEDAPLDSRGPLVAAMSAGILSRLGRFTEADAALASARERLGQLGAPRLALELDCIEAWVRGERGQRRAALAALRETEARAEKAGYLFVRLLCRVGAGRMLLELGRRAEGRAQLDAVEEEVRARGVVGLMRAARVARTLDVPEPETPPVPVEPREVRPGIAARQRALAALAAARSADAARATALLTALEPLARGEDFALEHTLAHLTRATLHRHEGRTREAAEALAEATHTATQGGLDPDLIAELTRPLASAPEAPRPQEAPAPEGVVLDARRHELRAPGKTVSLERRALPRRLLYALARQPGRTLPKEDCVRAMWNVAYDPRLHDNALRVHVSHVRDMLEGTGTRVVFEDPGYRLEVGPGFTFIAEQPPETPSQ